jgi:Zn-dependent protease
MIPFGPFDGAKIIKWNKIAYSIVVIIALILMII